MNNVNGLFDSLYSRLLLRDFFGKIVPGIIVILSICFVTFLPDQILKFIHDVPFFPALILIGFSWIVAFALQALGETSGLIRYHNYKTNEEFYARRQKFLTNTGVQQHQHQQLERLVVIKEACGNCYVALGISAVFIISHVLVTEGCQAVLDDIKLYWPVIVFDAGLIIFLAKMHFAHVKRQSVYMEAILDASAAGIEK